MAIEILKAGMDSEATDEADSKVREIVVGILNEVKTRGDAAVRELSEKFDKWSPESFRLSDAEIKELMDSLPEQTIDDIKFAQEQVRNFAQVQRDSMHDVEVETIPGVRLGHKNIPVNSVGCYVPGGRYPMVASAHMSIVTAKVAGVKRVIACTPAEPGWPTCGNHRCDVSCRCRRNLLHGWRSGCCGHGAGDGDNRSLRHAGRPG